MSDELILNHYRKLAGQYGLGSESSMADPYIRQAETDFILLEVGRFCRERASEGVPPPQILDVGCGNGYLLSVLRTHFPAALLNGREFTPELLELAQSRNLPGVDLQWGDCRRRDFWPGEGDVDIVITQRMIINILQPEEQKEALRNLVRVLRPGGLYVMVESFRGPLETLNKAAQEMLHPPYKESFQNLYLTEEVVEFLKELSLEETPADPGKSFPPQYLSTHFFLTRVFHPSLRPKGGRVKNTEFVKFFDLALPPAVGNYSPILFRTFVKGK